MAIFHGSQSDYELTLKWFSNVAKLIWMGAFVVVSGLLLYLLLSHTYSLLYILILGIFSAPLFWLIRRELDGWVRDYCSFKKGLKGSGAIWYELHKLPKEYDVYQHCIFPGRTADIDFVVVGPAGVFVIEVKSHDGKIEFRGNEFIRNGKSFEKNIRFQVEIQYHELHEYLLQETGKDIFVIPIIAFSNRWARLKFGLQKIKHIYVIKKPWLLKTIYQNHWDGFHQDKSAVMMAVEKLTPSPLQGRTLQQDPTL